MSVFIFRRSTERRNFPIEFLAANIGLACLLEVNIVSMPYFCSSASSTRRASCLFGAEYSGYTGAYYPMLKSVLWILCQFLCQFGVVRKCHGIRLKVFQQLFCLQVLMWSPSNRNWIGIGFGSSSHRVGLSVLNFPAPVFRCGNACVLAYLLRLCRILWRREPMGFLVFFRLGCLQKASDTENSINMFFFERCCTEIGLTGLICFVCSGVSIKEFVKCVPFFSADGWCRKWLICSMCFLFWVADSAGKMRRSSSRSISEESCIMPVASLSV